MNHSAHLQSAAGNETLPQGALFKVVIALVCAAAIALVVFFILAGLARLRYIAENGVALDSGPGPDHKKKFGEIVQPFSTLAELDM